MSKTKLYVDLHVLQTVPPSCVNRDDTGSPKTATYGGVTRARVSSQCWKKAVRDTFKKEGLLDAANLGIRTKGVVQAIAARMQEIDSSSDANRVERYARDTVNIASAKAGKPIIPPSKDKKKGSNGDAEEFCQDDADSDTEESSALFFLTPIQVSAVAQLAVQWMKKADEKPTQKAVHEALMKNYGIDIALFGRLVTQAPKINVEASAQVAHSISTHKISNEYDYFTAVDDLASEDTAGAAHLGSVEFNSATLYRYATVAIHELHKQLGHDTEDAVRHFIRTFVCSMPAGKQNTFANRTLPDAVLVTLRQDQPINFVGAFERPVPASDDGYVAASASRLVNHAQKLYGSFAPVPLISLVAGEALSGLGTVQQFEQLLETLGGEIAKYMGNGEER